jgi:hypothetical protein
MDMGYVVGPKDRMVIAKEICDRLGVEPGWIVLQRLADDHLEVYFVPPEPCRSLKGSLAPYVTTQVSAEEWGDARERAWAAAAVHKTLSL